MTHNKPKETNQEPTSGFLIAHFKRYSTIMILLKETLEMIYKTLLLALLILTISGCTDKPVSCTDPKFKKLAKDAYLQQIGEKLSAALIDQIGQYNESDKNAALERFKNNTFLKKFEFENLEELSRDEETNSAECEGTMSFDTYEGRFSYKIKYGIQFQGRKTTLNMISQ